MKPAFLLLLSFTFFVCKAQLCTGSLGEPIVNETFGTSGGQIPFSLTNFEYKSGCPGKGQYTLANLIFGCGEDRSWLMLAGDHTGNERGNYMLVHAESWDGITKTATVYSDTARNLCSNVTYVYSAWITNALRPISCGGSAVPANLSFRVTTLSGSVLGTFNTGDIPIKDLKEWKQFGLSFQVPPGESSVVFTLFTERKAGCGQGFAIDDITLQSCGPEVAATINGSNDPLEVCADFTSPFHLKGNYAAGFTNPAFQWQRSLDTGKTWIDIPLATTINYTVLHQSTGVILFRMAIAEASNIRSPQCRFLSNVLYTNVHPLPIHHAPRNLLGCLGKDLLLPQKDPFALQSWWTGSNGYSSTQQKAVIKNVTYADAGLYQFKQDFGFGCVSLDSFYVQVHPSTTVSVPAEYSVCEGQGVTLGATGEGTYMWQPSTGLSDTEVANPYASPRDSTQYKVVLTNLFGCKDSALVNVHVHRNSEVRAGPDKTILLGDTVNLEGFVKGTAVQYTWSPSLFINDINVASPKVSPPTEMRYTLTAESTVGCGKAEDAVIVKVYNDIFIPSGFSPNNDGKNDEFRIVAVGGYQLLQFQIYNRWGQAIYQAKDFNKAWDGRFNGLPQPQDTYVYVVQIRSANGKIINKQGTITLIR